MKLISYVISIFLWVILGLSGQFLYAIEIVNPEPPIIRVIKQSHSATNLLKNGCFDEDNLWNSWQKYESGFSIVTGEGRDGTTCIYLTNNKPEVKSGASQTLTLDQLQPVPIIISGWSKAENVSGTADSGYSIYVDILYNDGTPLWGQTANFSCGTHDWEIKQITIMPEKPVKTLTVYCLFRGHSGKVWFDDLVLTEIKPEGGAYLWQAIPITVSNYEKIAASVKEFSTKDNLKLSMESGLVYLMADNHEFYSRTEKQLKFAQPFGFLVRDVAENSDVYLINSGNCAALNLKLSYAVSAKDNYIEISGKITSSVSRDRAITLVFALPVDSTNNSQSQWLWWDDIRNSRPIKEKMEYSKTVPVRCGSTGTMSLYPLAAISNERFGLAIGIDMQSPAIYRLSYHTDLKQFFIAYDFGFSPETLNFPNSAYFKFVIYRFEPEWGFRAALQKYMEIFPGYFEVRSKDQGIWMPFTDVRKVEGWQDFGFKYHEGDNNVAFDDANGILSFRYTEPMTWWMPMDKELPRTLEVALQVRDKLLDSKSEGQKIPAMVTITAGMYDDQGKPAIMFQNAPWCNGAIWSLNPNPYIPEKPNFADWHWNKETMQRLYGTGVPVVLDGEYLDSLEGYVTTDLNFRRAHFKYTTVPLVFDADSKKVALFKGLAVFEITKWVSEQMRKMNKLTFANGVPYRFAFLCALLDVMGTETDWNHNGKWNPPSDSTLSLWRSMSGSKPYLLLMNTVYDQFSTNLVQKYFDRCAFYGFYPSMFSHNASENPYWQNPKWYNRDRELFKKYIPIIKRTAEAGWRPVTLVKSSNSNILLERFGDSNTGKIYITAFNPTTIIQQGKIQFIEKTNSPISIRELITGENVPLIAENRWQLELNPEKCAVFELTFRP